MADGLDRDGLDRDQLAREHLHLVPATRRRLMARSAWRVDEDDLDAAGYLGLARAIAKFDPDRGVGFPTFAITLIRGAMREYLREEDWVPRSIRHRAGEAGSREGLRVCLRFSDLPPAAKEDDLPPEVAEMPAPAGPPWEALIRQGRAAAVRRALARLTRRERQALWLYHGHGYGAEAAGAAVGLSRWSARRVLAAATEALKHDPELRAWVEEGP